MSIWDGNSQYYSGQGVMLIGKRSATGTPNGLLPVGNASTLRIAIAETLLEHKESQTGQRAIDLAITTQLRPTVMVELESMNARNLALALRGDRSDKLAGTVTNEANKAYFGQVSVTQYLQIATQVVKRGATTLIAFTAEGTPYDYKVNLANGSILINDGATTVVSAITTGGTAPSAITVGNPTDVTVATPAGFAVGDRVVFTGFTGADAALINGKSFETVAGAGTAGHVYLNVDTTAKTITVGTPLSCFDGQAITIDYTYASHSLVNAMTVTPQERWARFEGLNTVDGLPVVIDMFRFRISPLKEMSVISDDIYKYSLEGNLLLDTLQATGSQYFRVRLLDA